MDAAADAAYGEQRAGEVGGPRFGRAHALSIYGRTMNGVPASATKTREVARSRENGAANKLEVQKNWWASAHFRGLGAGAIGANLARNDTRIGSANNLAIGLVLCWSCFFIVASLN